MGARIYIGPRVDPATMAVAKDHAMRLYAQLPPEVQLAEARRMGLLLAMLLDVNDELRPRMPPAVND